MTQREKKKVLQRQQIKRQKQEVQKQLNKLDFIDIDLDNEFGLEDDEEPMPTEQHYQSYSPDRQSEVVPKNRGQRYKKV